MTRIVQPNFRRRPPPPRYRHPWGRPSNYYDKEALFILVAFALLCVAFYVREHWDGAQHPTAPSVEIEVVDGDTVRRDGRLYRLVAFNTPETGWRAKCNEERVLASKATARLKQLVASGSTDLTRVACACPAGTEETSACNAGRRCAKLKVDGQDVGGILIGEGLAERYVCRPTPLSSAAELVWALRMLESDGDPDDSQKKRNQHGDEENEPYPAPGAWLWHEVIPRDVVVVVGPHGGEATPWRARRRAGGSHRILTIRPSNESLGTLGPVKTALQPRG